MSFNFEREYEVHLLLADPSTPPLWRADIWAKVFPILQSLATHARGVPVTSSYQFEGSKKQPLKFSRIGWNDKGHAKWTHRQDTAYRFLSTEVWAPSRGACTKEGLPPDLLFTLWNEGFFVQDPTFRDTVLLAVPGDKSPLVEACSTAVLRLAEIARPKFHGRTRRPWARRFGQSAVTDSLGDMPTTGLFRIGDVGHQSPGNNILEEQWEELKSG